MHSTLDATLNWPGRRHAVTAEPASALPPVTDPIEAMAQADRSDWVLMRLILCAATATLLLALAASLPL
jgi:hypothetical protein